MRVGPATNVARINVSETITALWTFAHANGISLDDIIERTANVGVTIDGVLLKNIGIRCLGRAAAGDDVFQSDVVGDTIRRFVLNADGGMDWGDGSLIRDTDLFRALADVLATSDSFRVAGVLGVITDIITERSAGAGVTIDGVLLKDKIVQLIDIAAGGSDVIRTGVVADAFSRLRINASGDHFWGDGVAVGDVNLFRNAADVLKTDDSLEVAGVLGVIVDDITERTPNLGVMIDSTLLKDGGIELTADLVLAERTLVLNNAIHNNAPTGAVTVQRLDSDAGVVTITGFAGGSAGRIIFLSLVTTTNLVSLSHENINSIPANRMSLPNSAQITLAENEGLFLRYDDTLSRWFVAGKVI